MKNILTKPEPPYVVPILNIPLSFPADFTLDNYWIPEDEGLWFKPVRLNTIESFYTGFWYSKKNFYGSYHYHSGATHGIMLSGTTRFIDKNSHECVSKATEYFYIPGGVTHKAIVEAEPSIYLCYGTIEGCIVNLDDKGQVVSHTDVFSYVELAKKHYKAHNLDLSLLQNIII